MGDLSNRNFGLLVAYAVPGFIMLWGLSLLDPTIALWLEGPNAEGPGFAGVFYVTIASVSLGMTASLFRWIIIDTLHHATGLERPSWSDARLHERLPAYVWLIENYYRYYQFYGNTAVALVFGYGCWRFTDHPGEPVSVWIDLALAVMVTAFIAGSRSALSRYYRRAGELLNELERSTPMTNGGGKHTAKPGKPGDTTPKTETKPAEKKAEATK
ncbi:MAG: hypothetical protein AAF235_00935 [Planctomycetota bacterium]